MKTFITFLGLLIVCLSLLCFTSDMDRYTKMQLHLKACAEEYAAGSVLFMDQAAYSNGKIVFRSKDAEKYVNFLLAKDQAAYSSFKNGRISAEIHLFDDEKGYEGLLAYGVRQQRPCSVVTVSWHGSDILRLPYFKMTDVSRTAVYEWVE